MSTDVMRMAEAQKYGFTPEQVDVIKATIAPGATNEELALFLMVCQKTGLDPFSRQIYLSERRTKDRVTGQWTVKKTPETTIDGFRVIAERSNEYEGQVGPLWCGPDGVWQDIWLALDSMPSAAKVGVWRKGFREPVWGKALFEEYKQTTSDGKLNSMWQKMGANQVAKCAEALALRKAFPRDLSGLYAREEMGQADNAKEAQQDVAQRKIKELSAPKPKPFEPGYEDHILGLEHSAPKPTVPASTIIELADSLDTPPAVKKPPKKAVSNMTEGAKKRWLQAKLQLRAVRQDKDAFYYASIAPYKHCTEIPTKEEAEAIWKVLQSGLAPNSSKQDKALLLEVETHALRIGAMATQAALERRGLKSIEEVLTMQDGTEVDALLNELRTTV